MSPTALQSQEQLAQHMLVTLCSLESGSGQEARLLPALLPMLQELGAQVEVREPAPGRCNVLATWGTPRILFSTHLDTVPPFLPVRVDNGCVFARGACDAKGQMVAQFLAIQRLLAEGQEGFAWLGVCGEETDSLGAADALAWKPRFATCRVLINGEPTELKLATGQRGVDHLRLSCTGRAAHSGSPHLGRSATLELLDWVQGIRQLPCPEDPYLGPEVWNLGLLQGGNAVNVVPAEAEAHLHVRTVPGSTFRQRLEALCPAHGQVSVQLSEPPDTYPEVPGFRHAAMPFGSDAPQLRELVPDRTVVLAGPGSITVAHTDAEHLALTDLIAGIDLNRRLALHFLEQP